MDGLGYPREAGVGPPAGGSPVHTAVRRLCALDVTPSTLENSMRDEYRQMRVWISEYAEMIIWVPIYEARPIEMHAHINTSNDPVAAKEMEWDNPNSAARCIRCYGIPDIWCQQYPKVQDYTEPPMLRVPGHVEGQQNVKCCGIPDT